jgi:hypothetical protein
MTPTTPTSSAGSAQQSSLACRPERTALVSPRSGRSPNSLSLAARPAFGDLESAFAYHRTAFGVQRFWLLPALNASNRVPGGLPQQRVGDVRANAVAGAGQ